MSLLNWLTLEDRALVSVDTAAGDAAGNRFERSKVLALPHARTVVAGRGNLAFMCAVFERASNTCACFDDMYAHTAEWLRLAIAAAPAEDIHDHDVLLAGWSDLRNRMWSVLFQYRDAKLKSQAQAWGVSPADPFTQGDLQPPPDDRAMLDVARRQAAWASEHRDQLGVGCTPIGGRLLIAEITRQSISMRTVANFD